MNRDHAIKLAQEHAAKAPHTYTKVSSFIPHEWVIAAIQEAYQQGRQFERMNLSAPPGQVID